jgi:putative membrane protein
MMRTLVLVPILIGLLLAAVPTAAWATDGADATKATSLSDADQEFLDKAVQRSFFQIALGKLAAEQAESEAVKTFGRQAAREGERLHAALARLAKARNFSPPQELEKDGRDFRDNLAAVSGPDFDRVYTRNAVGDLLETMHLYQSEAMRQGDPAIEGFVAETLPRLQRQYDEERQAEAALPGTAPQMSPSGVVETRRPTPGPVHGTEGQ